MQQSGPFATACQLPMFSAAEKPPACLSSPGQAAKPSVSHFKKRPVCRQHAGLKTICPAEEKSGLFAITMQDARLSALLRKLLKTRGLLALSMASYPRRCRVRARGL